MLEGYLWGPELPRQTLVRAIEIAREAGPKVAFTLSESVCLPGRREALNDIIGSGGVDLLFMNDNEAIQLTREADLDAAVAQAPLEAQDAGLKMANVARPFGGIHGGSEEGAHGWFQPYRPRGR